MIQAIIFDLWETLGSKSYQVSQQLQKQFSIPYTPEYLHTYEHSIQLKIWNNPEAMAKSFLEHFSVEATEENIQHFTRIYGPYLHFSFLFPGMKELLHTLKEKYKLGLLSNTTNFERAFLDKHDIRPLFDAIVFSCDIAALKPSEEMFSTITKKLSLAYKDCLFIDDSKRNIAAAQALGMEVIHFQNVVQLKEELVSLDIQL
ncbi:MAG: HAD-IA family hydrolase [bacterium]|nr:HAD-IA family hydrolase [bacterium]